MRLCLPMTLLRETLEHVIVEAWVESKDQSEGKGEEKKEGGSWVMVDEQKEVVFTQRGERVEFEVAAGGPPARRFRLRIVSVADPGAANSVQLAGWELYGESVRRNFLRRWGCVLKKGGVDY